MKIEDLNEEEYGSLQVIPTKVLSAILNGQLDMVEVARRELINRGRDKDGNWVGFENSERLLGKPAKRPSRMKCGAKKA